MEMLTNMLKTIRSSFKMPSDNYSHVASIFNSKGKEQCLKFS